MINNTKTDDLTFAIDRLRLDSAEIVYCKKLDEKQIPPISTNILKQQHREDKNTQCTTWNFKKHSHDFLELLYFLDGQANIKGERVEYLASPFNMILYPESIQHQEIINLYNHQEIICLGITLPHGHSNLKKVLNIKDQKNRLRWVFTEIYHQYTTEEPESGLIIRSLIKLLFLYIQQFIEAGKGTSLSRIEQAICYIRENFNSSISIEELAQLVYLSPTSLNKLFKKTTGTTPINYVNLVRIEVAKKLLLTQDTSVAIVCEQVGIEDPKYFSRLFKKIEGITPSEYVNKYNKAFHFDS